MESAWCQKKLMEIRWWIKLESSKEKVMGLLNGLRDEVKAWMGETHPFLSEVWELESLWWLGLGEEDKAVIGGRESLSNMIQCCGNNNRHFHLGECFRGCGRW